GRAHHTAPETHPSEHLEARRHTRPEPHKVVFARHEAPPSANRAPHVGGLLDIGVPEPEPRHMDLDGLDATRRAAVMEDAGHQLAALTEACGPVVAAPVQVMANVTLDDRGLHTMELATYESREDAEIGLHAMPTPDPVPPELAHCLDEVLWDSPWFALEPGEVLDFALTMRFDGTD
ncbi:MAG: hypothetical protein KC656_19720, partial [Myxococcales bacterium]|nr:hypothetical protein [Myxococcales bacterium]